MSDGKTDICKSTRNCWVFIPLQNVSLHVSGHFIIVFLANCTQKVPLFDLESPGKIFKFIGFRSLENAFVSQKIESRHFYSCPHDKILPRFLILPPSQENYSSTSRQDFFENIFLPPVESLGKKLWIWSHTHGSPF